MPGTFQPANCVLCNNPGETRMNHFESEYKCQEGHHYLISDLARDVLAGSSNAMEGGRRECIEWLKTVPPGEILFIRTATSEEKRENSSLTVRGEYHTYKE
jgi:hypothetical protein